MLYYTANVIVKCFRLGTLRDIYHIGEKHTDDEYYSRGKRCARCNNVQDELFSPVGNCRLYAGACSTRRSIFRFTSRSSSRFHRFLKRPCLMRQFLTLDVWGFYVGDAIPAAYCSSHECRGRSRAVHMDASKQGLEGDKRLRFYPVVERQTGWQPLESAVE